MKFVRASLLFVMFSSVAVAAEPGFKELVSGDMSLQWKVEGGNLVMKLRAKAEGWLGVGFHASKGMKDAMFVIGAEKDGKVKVENHFGTSERAHTSYKELGCKETLTATSGKHDGEFTELSFTLPLNASDKCSKPIPTDKDVKLLLAHGSRRVFTAGHPYARTYMVNLSTATSKLVK